ncbi:MAG TPA: peptidoglycan DD-metalloendopeptidase family protein [Gammaproteobacteria bacterium]|nr:peptidoglycan DD-metalloendopeptidase family protein [Gammaproteobacteria bacterium]
MFHMIGRTLILLFSLWLGCFSPFSEALASTISEKKMLVKKGDTLQSLFKRNHLSRQDLKSIFKLKKYSKVFRSLKAGQMIYCGVDKSKNVYWVRFFTGGHDFFELSKSNNSFVARSYSEPFPVSRHAVKFRVKKSIYREGVRAGLDKKLLAELQKVLTLKLNLRHDVQPGDKITILYEKEHQAVGVSHSKRIIFAKLDGKRHKLEASRFKDSYGRVAYYDSKGRSIGSSFLRSPVKYTKISSPFNLHRLHPVLKKVRPHTGVDLAAPKGTAVKSVGEGRVRFAGVKGGYGNAVIIQHNARYQTLYAHLSRFPKKLRVGQKVKMSQVIGFVGSTGLATGPHLHYEFRVKGKPVNPLKVSLPTTRVLAKADLKRFRSEHRHWLAALKSLMAS